MDGRCLLRREAHLCRSSRWLDHHLIQLDGLGTIQAQQGRRCDDGRSQDNGSADFRLPIHVSHFLQLAEKRSEIGGQGRFKLQVLSGAGVDKPDFSRMEALAFQGGDDFFGAIYRISRYGMA